MQSRADAWEQANAVPPCAYGEALSNQFRGWVENVVVDVQSRGARADSWQNILTGTGTPRDKTTFTLFQQDGQIDFPTLEAVYHNDDLGATIVDAEPEQMFREGFEIHVEDSADAGDEFEEYLTNLGAEQALEEATIWARLYGGGGVFPGAQDGRAVSEPLDYSAIETVNFLQVLDRFSLWPNTWYSDPNGPKFGQPETYRVFTPTVAGVTPPVNVIIHESRLILFPGARTSIRKRRVNFGWEDSILQRPYQVLQSFGLSWASITHLLSDASQGVYKVKDLLNMILAQNKEALLDRMKLIDESRSTSRMLLVDSENEDFERTPTPFTGLPEMLDRIVQRLAAAARMPVTVLMGMSPAGLNATGASDILQWYDRIKLVQRRIAAPRVRKLAQIIAAAKDGPGTGDSLSVVFRPLYQLTATEEADRRLKVAQADDVYLSYGVVLPEEVRKSHWGGAQYSPEITVEGDITDGSLEAIAAAAKATQGTGPSAAAGAQPGQVSNDPNTGAVGAPEGPLGPGTAVQKLATMPPDPKAK